MIGSSLKISVVKRMETINSDGNSKWQKISQMPIRDINTGKGNSLENQVWYMTGGGLAQLETSWFILCDNVDHDPVWGGIWWQTRVVATVRGPGACNHEPPLQHVGLEDAGGELEAGWGLEHPGVDRPVDHGRLHVQAVSSIWAQVNIADQFQYLTWILIRIIQWI